MGAVAVGALLFAVLLLIVAAMVLQEVRKHPATEVIYVLEEVVPFVYRRLSDEALERLDRDDVHADPGVGGRLPPGPGPARHGRRPAADRRQRPGS